MPQYVVTGTASGIGRRVAERLLAAGSEVVGWDRASEGVPGTTHVPVDLSDAGAVEEAGSLVPDAIDGLINVAGVPGTAPPRAVLAVNLGGTRAVTEVLAPRIRAGGAVVTVASVAAYRCALSEADIATLLDSLTYDEAIAQFGLDGPQAYDAAKRALLTWNTRLTAQLLPRGVRACTVSPGPTHTPILDDFARTMGDSVERAQQVLTRHATADEVAAAVTFLAGPEASWINGIDVRVDGGLVALAQAAGQVGVR